MQKKSFGIRTLFRGSQNFATLVIPRSPPPPQSLRKRKRTVSSEQPAHELVTRGEFESLVRNKTQVFDLRVAR